MIAIACGVALIAIGAAVVMNVYRLLIGPDVADRVLALDTLVVNAIALIILAGIIWNSTAYFETALLFAMVGFLTSVSYCKYLLRGNVIE